MNSDKTFLFIISSVIYFKEKPLSYSPIRSKYSFADREAQTIQSIQSIRSRVPNSKIVLIESGYKKEISSAIINSVDQYIYTGGNQLVRLASDSKKKGLGEAVSLYFGLKKNQFTACNYCFKLSGRYFLNDQFDLNNFDLTKDFNFKTYNNPVQISTRLFGFKSELLGDIRKLLFQSFSKLFKNRSIEEVLYLKFQNYTTSEMKELGVSGLIGPTGDVINE